MSTSIESLNSLGNYMSLLQMNAQSMQKRQDDLFIKLDSDSSAESTRSSFQPSQKTLGEQRKLLECG